MAWIQAQVLRTHAAPVVAHSTREDPSECISFYDQPPKEEISIHEFEEYALDRLRVLKQLEVHKSEGKNDPEYMRSLLKQYIVQADRQTTDLKDRVSHFALKLAFCTTEPNRRWLLTQECELFKHRFNLLTPEHKTAFLQSSNLPYQLLSEADLQPFEGRLWQAYLVNHPPPPQQTPPPANLAKLAAEEFYCVPFEQVPDLVSGRKVFVHRGRAFVPKDLLLSVVLASFRQRLSKSLVMTAGRWATSVASKEADRLAPIITALSSRHLAQEAQAASATQYSGDKITLAQLPALAGRHFPLCMNTLYNRTMSDHHLKHAGRQQLSLFLKRVGLTLEESMMFWRTAFAPRMPAEKFEKEYAYNVRHGYGKEGRRKDYEPHNCLKVISANPGVGEAHGCPFKTMPEDGLRAAMGRLGVSPQMQNEAVEKAKGSHFQVACARVFEDLFGEAPDAGVTHPNTYFVESMAIAAARNPHAGRPGAAPATPAAGRSASAAVPATPSAAGSAAVGTPGLTPGSSATGAASAGWVRTPMQATPAAGGAGAGFGIAGTPPTVATLQMASPSAGSGSVGPRAGGPSDRMDVDGISPDGPAGGSAVRKDTLMLTPVKASQG